MHRRIATDRRDIPRMTSLRPWSLCRSSAAREAVAPLLRHPKLCATGESAFSGPSRSVRGCGAPRPFPMAALPATNHTPAGTLGGTRPPAFEARSTSGGSDMRLLIHDIARSVGERRCQVKSVRACLLADDDAGILSALSRLLEPSCEIVGKIADGKARGEAAARLAPDVIVLTSRCPSSTGWPRVSDSKRQCRPSGW